MASTKALRGADIKLYINGRVFSGAVSLRFNASTGTHAIMGVDQGQPFELAPGPQTITGSIDAIRIRNSGGLEGAGLVPPESKLLLARYFSLTAVDRVTDTVILQIDEAALIDQNWQTAARSIMTGSFSFQGIGWVNEDSFQ